MSSMLSNSLKQQQNNNENKQSLVSSTQALIYNSYLNNPNQKEFSIFAKFLIKPDVDIPRLMNAIQEVFNSNDVLKTKFIIRNVEGISQVYAAINNGASNKLDIERYTTANSDLFVRPFDLSKAPLLRVGFVENKILMIDIHRIIADSFSFEILIQQILNCYHKKSLLSPSTPPQSSLPQKKQFIDLMESYRQKFDSGFFQKEMDQLKQKFNCEYDIANFPKRLIGCRGARFIKEFQGFTIDGSNYRELNNFLQENHLNPKSFFMSIYGYVMSKYCRQQTIYLSLMNNNRKEGNKEVIGMFSDVQPFILKFDEEKTLGRNIEKIQSEYSLFENVQDEVVLFSEWSDSINLFKQNHCYNFTSSHHHRDSYGSIFVGSDECDDDAIAVQTRIFLCNIFDYDIIFNVSDTGKAYEISMDYNTGLVEEYFVKNFMDSLMEVIKYKDNYNKKIGDIEYIPEKEKNRILNDFNSLKIEYEGEKQYHTEFTKLAKAYPDECIVIHENKYYTYSMLDKMSNSLAHYLINVGVKRGDVVPIICDRTYIYIVAVLGIMKAGGAFLTIDPEFPRDRVQVMLDEVKANIILYSENSSSTKKDICCLYFTSGSTGKPKGILISHGNMINCCIYSFYSNTENEYVINNKAILGFSKFTYALCLVEVFYSLLNHRVVVLCNNNEYNNPELIGNLIIRHKVNYICTTPTRLSNYMNNDVFRDSLRYIKIFTFGGEKASIDFLRKVVQYSDARIQNGYGQTEMTATCTFNVVTKEDIIKGDNITIGKPACNCEVYILDSDLKPVPVGVEGTIFVAGKSVCQGYLNMEEHNRKVFIPCPFRNNNIMFNTGDIGKWANEGKLICVGRSDFQVKIRGQRIEINEIENSMKKITEINDSVVIDREKKENGEKYLACYYTIKSKSKPITTVKIREHLSKFLPLYMIPSYFIKLDEIPLTANGKLNRKALPEPTINVITSEEYIAPETETEKILCEIYCKVFKVEEKKQIGRKSTFFELGGDSLTAITITSYIIETLNIKLNIKDIITHSSISDLGEYIDSILGKRNNSEGEESNLKKENDIYCVDSIKRYESTEFPITSQQLGIYIDSIKNPMNTMYNVPISLKINPNMNVDMKKLENVLTQIINKHEIFRSKYYEKEVDGKPEIYGCIDDNSSFEFEYYTKDKMTSFIRPFDLAKPPLIRVGFVGNEYLLVDMHHIISDGMTITIFIRELNGNYFGGKETEELVVQFSDYAIHMHEKMKEGYYDKQISFYRDMFQNEYELLNLPKRTDGFSEEKEESEENGNIGLYSKNIDEFTTRRINEYLKKNEISKSAFFLSIYGFILSKYSGQDTIYTSVINANRNNYYVGNMIGMFASTQPILLKYDDEVEKKPDTFINTIKKNMNVLMEIFNNQDISFSELISELNLKKVNNSFIYQPWNVINGNSEKTIFVENIEDMSTSLNKNNSKFEISMDVIENQNDFTLVIEYNKELYSFEMIKCILESYLEMVRNVNSFGDTIDCIEYIPLVEKNKIINEFNREVSSKHNTSGFYHEEFSKFAKENPEKCAIVQNEFRITYGELDRMSNSLAHYLREKGIKRNDIVPIISERSYFYMVATLAISKAGGAYLPVDRKLPLDRVQFILEEVHPKIVLYYHTEDLIKQLDEKIYKSYDVENHNYKLKINSIETINDVEDTCYVLFTSGTTGKPKGALISHFNVYNYLRNFNDEEKNKQPYCIYNILKDGKVNNVLGITNFSFDASQTEITVSLMNGMNLILADDTVSFDISLLAELIMENNVEYINTTPTRFKLFMEDERFRQSIKNLKLVNLGGEKLTMELCKEIRRYSPCKIYNSYGPTECTVDLSYKEVDPEKEGREGRVTIGKQLCNCKAYILDKFMKPVPVGVEGEIFIGGYGVGKGYLNRKDLTKEKFIPCPFDKEDKHNSTMYRTGDLGRWTENGEIEYLGRIDFQVKIHGQRIELSEIENVICEIDGIDNCVVIDKLKGSGDKYLIGYYIRSEGNDTVTGKEIRSYLKSKLPMYMVPNYFKQIEKIPLSSSSKLDRKALPEPTLQDLIKEEYISPETDIEKRICSIYSRIFNIPENEIGRNADFYEIGGDSLNAIRVSSLIEKDLKIKLNIRDILSHSLISNFGKYIEDVMKNNKEENQVEVIERRNQKEFPITSQQFGVYVDSIKNPESVIYNMPDLFKIKEGTDIEKLKKAFITLFNHQDILRTKYEEKEVDGKTEIYGFVDDECSLEFEYYTKETMHTFLRPFNLSKAPLLRVGFIENELIFIDMHHIISDGMTMFIILRELNAYYNDKETEELPIQFSDYAIHMNEKKIKGYYDDQVSFYREMFNTNYELLSLPKRDNENILDSKAKENGKIGLYSKTINETVSQKINEYVKKNGISKSAFFLSIYGFILSKYSGQDKIYTSMVNANRNNYYVENMIGMFASTQPILLKYGHDGKEKEDSFLDIIKKNMNVLMDLYNNQDISFSELINELNLKKVNNLYVYQPNDLSDSDMKEDEVVQEFSNNELYEMYLSNNNKNKFEIIFEIVEKDNNYILSVSYNNVLYEEVMIDRLVDSYLEVLNNMEQFNNNLIDIEYIPEKEKTKILKEFNSNRYDYVCNKVFHEEYSKMAMRNPEKTAVIYNGIEYSYRLLDEMSNSLANYLRMNNIEKGDVVPIVSERSVYYIIGLLAVMKAGAAYLPIDPEFPKDRIEYMVNEVDARLVLKQVSIKENDEKLKFDNGIEVYSLTCHNYNENTQKIENTNTSSDLCYIIFTSGTTGKPKGTLITHNNLVNYCLYSKTIQGKEDIFKNRFKSVLAFSKFTFDMSVFEIHYPLLKGSTVVLCNDNEYNDPNLLSDLISNYKVEFMITVPSRIINYMKYENFKKCLKHIKVFLIGGEILNKDLIETLMNNYNADVFNGYGPTETTVVSNLKKLIDKSSKMNLKNMKITIGKPLCNCQLYVLDKFLNPVPIGVEGEIFIGGYGVGKGYLNRDDLTKEKFIICPFEKQIDGCSNKMYRTGDLGKWTEDGEILCIGRIDFQIKINGQRIELNEISNNINRMEQIENCVVIDKMKPNGDKYLIGYYIPKEGSEHITGKDIRNYLKNKLPMYMIPNYFMKILEIPLSPNGKLDRKALPDPDLKDLIREEYVAPENETEKLICEIYSRIFNIPENEIGRSANFYELGGNSLNAIRVSSLIEKAINLKLNIKSIISKPYIYDLAEFIENTKNTTEQNINAEIIKKYNRKEFPITSQQFGVYIDSIKNKNSITYNVPFAYKLNKGVDIEKIKLAFGKLMENQEVLKSKYVEKEINNKTEIYGIIDDDCTLAFENYSFENVNSFIRPFDLSKAPLIRVGFIENDVLLLDMHHIISDGMTNSIILKELNNYYQDLDMETLAIQYSDYALHLNEQKNKEQYEKQIKFYENMFNNEDYDLLNLPKKIEVKKEDEQGKIKTNIGRCSKRIMDESVIASIDDYIKSKEISRTAFFLTIYGYVLSKYSGQDAIYSSIISANRNSHYVENMIGMFATTQPLLLKYNNENESFTDIMKRNMEILMSVYENQDVSFSELVEKVNLLKINNTFAYQPLDSLNSDINNSIMKEFELEENILYGDSNSEVLNDMTKFDITFNLVEERTGYLMYVEYNSELYEESFINKILDSMAEVISNETNKYDDSFKNVEYIPKEEKKYIISKFNNNTFAYDNNKLYHEEFSRIAKKHPRKYAIICNENIINFKELDEMTNSLAHHLRRSNVGRGDIVPIISERSFYYIVGAIAIMKAGGAFLPIDPEFPEDRILYMINEANAKFALTYITNSKSNMKLNNCNIRSYKLENHDYSKFRYEIENVNSSDDLCYVIFTSGTTGKPKGTLICHDNLINYCLYSQSYNGIQIITNKFKNSLACSKYTFDMSICEIFYPIINSKSVYMCNELEYNNPELLGRIIIKHRIDYIFSTPSRIENYMKERIFEDALVKVKCILLGGEKLTLQTFENIINHTEAKIFNLYGPTETTIMCSLSELSKCYKENKKSLTAITIGKPLCNCKVYILDKYLKPVPIGIVGEIFIAGHGVGKGYLNREELTKEKFVDCPFVKDHENYGLSNKMYGTGDLGRWNENGEIECLGRIDYQVKIRGQRIELSEIENTINEMEGIEFSTVLDKEKEDGSKYLIGYYMGNENITQKDIRQYLKSKLPMYMIPNYFIRISELPITSNGKLDRKALPEPSLQELMMEQYVAPETEIEKVVCGIYSKIFNINKNEIGKYADFYELGGNSLNAIRVSSLIEKKLDVKLNIKDILSNPIISDLCKSIEAISSNNEYNNKEYIIERRNEKEFPITSQQFGVYVDSIKNPESIMYNVPNILKLANNVDLEKLKLAFISLFNRHDILRSKYNEKEVNGKTQVYGYIEDDSSLEFEYYNKETMKNSFIRPFELSKAPLFRVGFVDNEYVLIDMHHIISDGMSMSIILRELNCYYYGNKPEELVVQFNDYAIHMNEKKKKGYYDNQISFYREMFENTDYELLDLPKTSEEQSNKNGNIGLCNVKINKNISGKINEYIKKNGISKAAFFLSIYGFVLSKYSGQDSIYTSVMNANRNNYYVENMIGMFVSTQPILLKYDDEVEKKPDTFINTIKKNMNILMELYNNQDISFSELISELNLKKVNNSFIFQPFNLLKNDYSDRSIFDNHSEDISGILNNSNNNAKFDISMDIVENENDYDLNIDFNTEIYSSEIVNSILESYLEVVRNVDNFDSTIDAIEYISESDRNKILYNYNHELTNRNEINEFYHEKFNKFAKENPEKLAIVQNDFKLTYGELDRMSNSLAHYLRKQGVSRNDIVPIVSIRSYFYIIATLAVSKAGGAFLPVDPRLPLDRIQFIIGEVHPKVVLYYKTEDIISKLDNKSYSTYNIEKHNYKLKVNSLKNINDLEDICYILFTSGTTGKPKGTVISHFNIANYLRQDSNKSSENNISIYDIINGNHIKNLLAITNFSFDISHEEITYSLFHGLTIVLADEETSSDLSMLNKCIMKNKVDFINTTPSRFKIFMENEKFKNSLRGINAILFAGEELPIKLCKDIRKYTDCKIYNGYGPTETTVICTFKEVNENETKVTIGKPNNNYQLYILDKYLKHVPVGVEGEIFIGGYGVGKGYLNREDLTKQKYVPNPYDRQNSCSKMYRTGDLGKWTKNGEIDYLGRIDFQIKINGQRIELGDIENAVNEIKEIDHAVVIDKINEVGGKYLICYYISSIEINKSNIRKYLQTKLPTYMIPNYYKRINELPLSPSGKLNRKVLPKPSLQDIIKEQYIAPETETEKLICEIYSKIFNINENEIGRNADFYELGGNSLFAIRVSSLIEKELKVKITMKDIISNSLICDLGKFIENTKTNTIEVIERYNKKEFPITSQQLGVYIDSIKNKDSIIYNMPSAYKLNNNINIEKLKLAFIKLMENQEVLKSRYIEKEVNDKIEIYGIVDDEFSLSFEQYNYNNVNSFIRPFDLSKSPLIRVGFIDNDVLLLDMHHIISDGMTTAIILKELNNYYNNLEVEPLDIQFSDYAIHLNEKMNHDQYEKQIEFYDGMFSNEDYALLNLPKKNESKKDMNVQPSNVSKSCAKRIDESMFSSIEQYIKSKEISRTAFFLTIYGYVLSKYSGQDTIYSSIISANRNSHYVENMIGMFATTQPLLLKYNNGDESFTDIMKRNMNIVMNIYENQDISFSELVKSLKLMNINNAFVYQPLSTLQSGNNESIMKEIKLQEIFSLEDFSDNNDMTKFDITFNLVEERNNYLMLVEYNSEIYDEYIINKILDSMVEVISNQTNNYDDSVKNIEYIPKEEKDVIINKFNSNSFNYGNNKLYHEEFSKIARLYPNKTAIINSGMEISYKELDEMSNSLGHYLRSINISKGDIVPIICERSYFYLVGALAVMKSGAAFLPIDPEFPEDRILYMINEVNAKFILTYITNIEIDYKLVECNIQGYRMEGHNYNNNRRKIENINSSEDLCYIIFTSGTTGKPKGTLICHDNFINYSLYSQKENGKNDIFGDEFDNILAISKFTFDMSMAELYYPLLRGSRIILCNEFEFNNPDLIGSLITKYDIRFIFAVPSRIENYMNNSEIFVNSIRNVKWMYIGGEKLNHITLRSIKNSTNAKLYNLYGPTETTVICTLKPITDVFDENVSITIGKPLCNCKLYILDRYFKPVPIGTVGEIFVAGNGVGKGYLNREELTKEKFVDCPFVKDHENYGLSNKMYGTGDLGRWNENGEIECLGRIDYQVKIRGQRIELSEIENTINEMEGIEFSTVLDKEKEDGSKYLIGYYMGNENITQKDIRQYLKSKLPMYMIPNYFIRISELPITSNGKLDRKALPEPSLQELMMEQYVAPETEIEKVVCGIYSKIFNINKNEIGKYADFYELGGNSLNAIKAISEIKKLLNVKINMKDVMNNSVVYSLATYIENNLMESNENQIETIKRYNKSEFPITAITSCLLFDMNFESIKKKSNNMTQFYKLSENVNMERLNYAFNEIIKRHEVLKSNFIERTIDGKQEVYIRILDDVKLEFEYYTRDNFEKFVRHFDITKDLLIRVGIIENKILIIDIDHKISDGYSFGIIINELNKIYNGEKLEKLPIQYSDYAIHYDNKVRNEGFSDQIEYYKNIFNESVDIVKLPTIENKTKNDDLYKDYKTMVVNSSTKIYDNINKITKENNLSKMALFLTLYSLVMSKYTGQKSIFSLIISSNRTHENTENLIGLFLKYMPILVKLNDDKLNLIELTKKCMDDLLTILSFDVPYLYTSEKLQLPKANSCFKFDPYEMLNNNRQSLIETIDKSDIYNILGKENSINSTKFKGLKDFQDINFVITEKKDTYEVTITYNCELYSERLIEGIIGNFLKLMENTENFKTTLNNVSVSIPSINTSITEIKERNGYVKNISNNKKEIKKNVSKKQNKLKNKIRKFIKKIKKSISLKKKNITKNQNKKNQHNEIEIKIVI